MDIDEIAVQIIANAGDSKSCSFGAIEAAKEGDDSGAKKLLEDSTEALMKAHEAHTKILVNEANGQSNTIPFILIHASNHLSIAELTREFAEIIVNLYKEVKRV